MEEKKLYRFRIEHDGDSLITRVFAKLPEVEIELTGQEFKELGAMLWRLGFAIERTSDEVPALQ